MITSHIVGREIKIKNGEWVWSDTEESIKKERPCIRCGKMPTEEGYDFCLGKINGASSACCGHGVTEPYIELPQEEY